MIKNLSLICLCLCIWANSSSAGISQDELKKIEVAAPAKAAAKPQKPRKLLVFTKCQGFMHDSIPYCTKALEIMGKKTGAFEVVQSDDISVFKPESLKQFDAVCFNNTTRLDFNDVSLRKSLIDFVKSGKGVIGIHAATDNFYNWPEAAEMIGGIFNGHPWIYTGTWAFKIDDAANPINAGFKRKGFKISDEIYRIKPFNLRQNCHVLVSLDFNDPATKDANGVTTDDRDNPVSWIRDYGKGRVFYCVFGHNREIYWNAAILQHYLAGIQFALGDLPVSLAAKDTNNPSSSKENKK